MISAPLAMDLDQQLLDQLDPDGGVQFHFYEWDAPTLTYGYFLPIAEYIHIDAWEALGGKLARRPTGGGMMFHQEDFAFSVFVPRRYALCQKPLAFRYRVMQEAIRDALVGVFPALQEAVCVEGSFIAAPFCMATPTTCDLVFGGRKIVGAAQRVKKQGMLYQVAISLHIPENLFFRNTIKDPSWADLLMQDGRGLCKMSFAERKELKVLVRDQLLAVDLA